MLGETKRMKVADRKPYISATAPTELVKQLEMDEIFLGKAARRKDLTDAEWYERHQMRVFLLYKASTLNYPVSVFHTSADFPDFRLHAGGEIIGVEATRIANEQLERVRSLGLKKTITISPFLVKGPRRNNAQLADAALTSSQMWMGNTMEETDSFWKKQATEKIAEKTRKLNEREDVPEINWLLLWDKLSGEDVLPERLSSTIDLAKFPVPAPTRRWNVIVWQDEQLKPELTIEV